MILSAFRDVFATTPAAFSCDCDAEEASRRLNEVIAQDGLNQLKGHASPRRVRLSRSVNMQGARASVQFLGRITTADGRTHIEGRFGIPWQQRLGWCLWFGFFTIYTSMAIFAFVRGLYSFVAEMSSQHAVSVQGVTVPLVIMCAGFGFIYVFQRMLRYAQGLSKDDVAWISLKVEQALTDK